MTANKRFLRGFQSIRDTKEDKEYNFHIDNAISLLNELNDENEWLKSEIQKLYNFVKIDVEHNIEVYPKSLMELILEILKIIGDVE